MISAKILTQLIKDDLGLIAVSELQFAKPRKFRFDLAIPKKKIAIEFEGGVFTRGRHTRSKGYLRDMEKYNLATLHGWKLLRYAHVDYSYNRILQDIKILIND